MLDNKQEFDNIPSEETSSASPPDGGNAPAETPDIPQEPVSSATEPEKTISEEEPVNDLRLNGIHLAMSLCDALLDAVGRDQFHGGVRPDNIGVRNNSVQLGGKLKHGVGEFTPQELEYMAPELFWDGLRTPSADVYSIGLVLYSVYNYGRLPFWPRLGAITPNGRAGALQKRMNGTPIPLPAAADPDLQNVILRALAFSTEERWQDVQELRDALGDCDVSDGPTDLSMIMSGLVARGADPNPLGNEAARQAVQKAAEEAVDNETADEEADFTGRRYRRRKKLSWIWMVILLAFIFGSLILLLGDCGGSVAPPNDALPGNTVINTATMVPTASPTPGPTATPEPSPTAEPTAVPDGPRYVVYTEDVSWGEAVARCTEMGGRLAMPTNAEELAEIIRELEEYGLDIAWLGASRQADGSWATPEGDVLSYFFWGENEPSFFDAGDGAKEDYMLLWKFNDQWVGNDSREDPLKDYFWVYTGKIGYVCQMY